MTAPAVPGTVSAREPQQNRLTSAFGSLELDTRLLVIIVARNIDLSIGSVLGLTGMAMAMLQAEWIPRTFGLGFDQPWTWVVTVIFGLILGVLIGGVQGFVIAYIGVPSFIVTLGGLLVWRGA